jgi:hypothetical protein
MECGSVQIIGGAIKPPKMERTKMNLFLRDEAQTPEIIAYPIDSVPAVAGVTRTQIFQAIRGKELTARKHGRRTIIEISELRRWISTFPTKGRAPEISTRAA